MPRRARTAGPTPEGASVPPAGAEPVPSPPAAARGFQGWREADEVRLARTTQRRDPEALVAELRVVYLGNNSYKTEVRPGALIEHKRKDGTTFSVPAPEESPGNHTYHFARVDGQGQEIQERLTQDNRPFSICKHIGHLAWFLNALDGERNQEYELRGPTPMIERVKAYDEARRLRRAQNREAPVNVIRAMGDPWGQRGGEVAESVSLPT